MPVDARRSQCCRADARVCRTLAALNRCCPGMQDTGSTGWLEQITDAWGCRMLTTLNGGKWRADVQGRRMLSVPAPSRKEHLSLLLKRGGPGMQQYLIGQRDLWSLRVAIPTLLWFPASQGVKCRVELAARGGPGARGTPGLCSRGGVHSPLPESCLAPLSCPALRIPWPLLPTSSGNFAARRGRRAGTARHREGSPGHAAPSLVSLGRALPLPHPSPSGLQPTSQEHPSRKLPSRLPAAWERGLAAAALPGAAGALSTRLDLPPMPAGLPRARKAVSSPGRPCCSAELGAAAGSLLSAGSWSHEPLPAALQEAAGPGDPLLLPVCHRDPLPR